MGFENQRSKIIEVASLPAILERHQLCQSINASEFLKWLDDPSGPPPQWCDAFSEIKGLSAADWMELVSPVAGAVGGLASMPERDRGYVAGCILDFVKRAFTDLWRLGARSSDRLLSSHGPADLEENAVRNALKEFILWVESLPDSTVVEFCWDLLAYDWRGFTPPPVLWLHWSGRLSGAISLDYLKLAVSLADEANAMHSWPEERWSVMNWGGAAPYMELLGHGSYLVRSAASLALGTLFSGVQTNAERGKAPSWSEMMSMIQGHEVETPGIAGPFLEGAWRMPRAVRRRCRKRSLGLEPEESSPIGGDFDMKSWFIETLRKSFRLGVRSVWQQEFDVPHFQTLEFYAHEMFDSDENAIREFLKMGRRELAVMTATEDPTEIPKLMPVLSEMAASRDPEVAAAIREYLSTRSHHAGLRHLHKGVDDLALVPVVHELPRDGNMRQMSARHFGEA